MTNRINSYTSWQPLEEVIVGRAYPPDYFDFIDDRQVRAQMEQILAETAEDLDNLQRTIERYGARVRRPNIMSKDQFQWFQTEGGGAPLPPLTPRDWQISLGDRLLRVLNMPELDDICADYADQVINPHKSQWDEDCILNGASASCIVRVGRDVFFDNSDYLKPEQTRWIVDNCLGPEYRIHEAITDGHGDAVFADPVIHEQDRQLLSNYLNIVHSGIGLGEVKHNKLVPGHALALTPELRSDAFPDLNLNLEEALNYLRKDPIPGSNNTGFHTVSFENHRLGFVNVLPNRVNNLLPMSARILNK